MVLMFRSAGRRRVWKAGHGSNREVRGMAEFVVREWRSMCRLREERGGIVDLRSKVRRREILYLM